MEINIASMEGLFDHPVLSNDVVVTLIENINKKKVPVNWQVLILLGYVTNIIFFPNPHNVVGPIRNQWIMSDNKYLFKVFFNLRKKL